MTILLDIPVFFGLSIEVYIILLVLAIPSYFFWCWLLKKFIKVENTRKIATWTATILAAPLIYVALFMLWFFSLSYHSTSDFDKGKWIADKEKRYEYSEDIIESKMLIGKTKREVRQILGDEGNTDKSDYWTYNLGYKPRFISIDPDVLDIEFKDGKVIKVGQHQT